MADRCRSPPQPPFFTPSAPPACASHPHLRLTSRHDVRAFVDDPSAQTLSVGANISAIRFAFSCLKGLVVESRSRPGAAAGGGGGGGEDVAKLQLQLQQVVHPSHSFPPPPAPFHPCIHYELYTALPLLCMQRNTEIAILVNMLNKPGSSGVDALSIRAAAEAAAANCPPMRPQVVAAAAAAAPMAAAAAGGGGAELLDTELLKDRNKAFEHFRRSYRKNEQIESTKMQLKAKYDEAQGLGESVRQVKNRIGQMKALMEQRRVEKAMQGLSGGGDAAAADPEEERMVATMERDRGVYKRDYERLRELKGEIEFMQMTLEKSRAQLTRDFESWFAIMERQAGGGGAASADAAAQPPSSASASQAPTARAHAAVAKQVSVTNLKMLGSFGGGDPYASLQTLSLDSALPPPAALHGGTTGNREADADIAAFYR